MQCRLPGRSLPEAVLLSRGRSGRVRHAGLCRPGPAAESRISVWPGFGVKDNIDVVGLPSTCGSSLYANYIPRFDASCVALLRQAGAVPVGKTVTAEFAFTQPGPTTNPWNAAHTPGGSSSGSAAAVACGAVAFALGTQTGGSVIRPAAYCGVLGFKPTRGLVHRAGLRLLCDSLDTIGWFARSVADCWPCSMTRISS